MPHLAPRTAAMLAAVSLTVVGALALAGCTSSDRGGAEAGTSDAVGTLGAGFSDPDHPPAPEATLHPAPDSWDDVHPPAHYRVVLLSPGPQTGSEGRQIRTLTRAVKSWAADEDVTLVPVVAASPDALLDAVGTAVAKHADLVVSVGNDMVDPIAAMSPSALHQQFLVLGAEIAEPTSNVTAADWTGAGFRGEGLGTASHHDPATFTDERSGRALRAGVAAVLHDLNGIVVWVR